MEDYLHSVSSFFKRMNAKIKLITLLNTAKQEFDNYDYASCSESLKEAYKLDKTNPAVLRGLGCLKQFEKDYQGAVDLFEEALKYSESKEIEYTLIGTVYYLQDKLEEALKYFNLAIDINDNCNQAYDGRNQVMFENHLKIIDLQEALEKHFK